MSSDRATVLPSPLLVISDRHRSVQPLPAALADAVRGGARWLRVREPDLDLFAYVALCRVLVDTVADARVTWSVRPQAYLLLRTAYPELRLGVHLTARDAPWAAPERTVLTGRSVHAGDLAEHAAVANDDAWDDEQHDASDDERRHRGPDYLLFAPVFATASKPGIVPAGPDALAGMATRQAVPIVALGGITPSNVAACRTAGAAGVAVCGGVIGSEEPMVRVREYLEALAGRETSPEQV